MPRFPKLAAGMTTRWSCTVSVTNVFKGVDQRHDAGQLRPTSIGMRRNRRVFPLFEYQELRCYACIHVFILRSPLAEGPPGRRTHRACTVETACSRRAAAPGLAVPPDREVETSRTETPAQSWTAAIEPMVAVYIRTGEIDDRKCQPYQGKRHIVAIKIND